MSLNAFLARPLLLIILVIGVWAGVGAQSVRADYQLSLNKEQIRGPASPSDYAAWREAMLKWRDDERTRIHYDDSAYALPGLQWTQKSFVQTQMMVEDRYFYDPVAGKYTVGKYLDDLKKRYGGIDSVLVWPTYPNIGVDARNTDDMLRSMPGGMPAIKQAIQDFHSAGVQVLFPIHPWDVGTRDPGQPWSAILPATMQQVGADGLNGDTMNAVTKDYFQNALQAGHPLALEPELGLTNATDQLGWNTMSWGYWSFPLIPMVSKNKWLEPRHMVHVNDRWATNKTDLLQFAFFNGVGFESWENVWGIWNQMSERDAEALRRTATIEREFSTLLVSTAWEPHTPTIQNTAVFASKWPDTQGKQILWTLVNRRFDDLDGAQIDVPYTTGLHYYDLWHGVEITPEIQGNTARLSFIIEGSGYGAILASDSASLPPNFSAFVAQMHDYAQTPLKQFSDANVVLSQQMTPIAATKPAASAPPGMVQIPGGTFTFQVNGIEIEGGNQLGVDVQYPWENAPIRHHLHTMQIKPFYIDKYDVTNADLKNFLTATGYKPKDAYNFLKDWTNGEYPAGWDNKPVTWVSLEDARAYAAWAGKRLPHEWEWQYAAQGSDGRLYPWGNTWDAANVPSADKSRTLASPADVNAFPNGASSFGVMDMVGNVWQWTDEYSDEHTRFAILRGGSYFQPQGSQWYFPQAYQLNQHGKYLLMAPGRDRSGTIGFRCTVDAP